MFASVAGFCCRSSANASASRSFKWLTDVEKVNPDLVVHDADGHPYTVRYDAVNVMLLNEFLKEHRNVAEQQSTIVELKAALAKQQDTNAQQQQQIETLAAGLQKVSAAVELKKATPTQVADTR